MVVLLMRKGRERERKLGRGVKFFLWAFEGGAPVGWGVRRGSVIG
jgi:hypothetical protein